MKANHGLKSLSGVVMVLLLLGCNGDSPTASTAQPPAQTPPGAARTGFVWGNVHAASGACLVGAVVEVLDGVRTGARSTQAECQSPWDYGDAGYSFRDLPPDINVRLRASKDGYQSQEMTVFATSGPASQSNFVLPPE